MILLIGSRISQCVFRFKKIFIDLLFRICSLQRNRSTFFFQDFVTKLLNFQTGAGLFSDKFIQILMKKNLYSLKGFVKRPKMT